MGGIPSATTEVGFFDIEVGTKLEGTDGDTNDGRVGRLEVSNGSTGRGGKGDWDDPCKIPGVELAVRNVGFVLQFFWDNNNKKQHEVHSGPPD